MSNTLPILGVNNLGLTSRLPRWDYRLKYTAGSLVIYDTDSDSTIVSYGLFFNPDSDQGPTMESDTPNTAGNNWGQITVVPTPIPTP